MKYDDLQGIRALAIIFVFIFHLKPKDYPNGFIGVDMFFVLSGFLMSMILTKNALTITSLATFYTKRFIRIVPVFYTVAIGIYFACSMFLLKSDRSIFLNDMIWAASFTSNMQPIYEVKGYWDQISSYNFWLHCWSLGVEIQFYTMAPFLLALTRKFDFQTKLMLFGSIAALSLAIQTFSPPNVSYGLVFSRIWQFLLGSLAYEAKVLSADSEKSELQDPLLEEQDEENPTDNDISERCYSPKDLLRDLIIVSLVITMALQNPWMSQQSTRVLATVSTAILIFESDPSSRFSLLSTRAFVYIGDISYSFYLIHWPTIVITKYRYNLTDLSGFALYLAIFMTIFLTLAYHHFVEKILVKQSLKISAIVCIICLLIVIVTLPTFESYEPPIHHKNRTKEELNVIIKTNSWEHRKVYYNIGCSKDTTTMNYTKYYGEPQLRCVKYSNGTARILIIGNSIGYRVYPLINDILRGRYKELRLFTKSSVSPIANEALTEATKMVVDRMRPDILFLCYGKNDQTYLSPVVNLTTDSMFQVMQKNIDYYSNRTQYLVIDLPFYIFALQPAYEIVKRLQQNLPLDDLKISRTEAEKQQQYHIQRLKSLNCSNCYYNKVNEAIFEGDYYYYYNRSSLLAYSKDGWHFTEEGLKLIRKPYEDSIETILRKLEKKL